MRFGACCAPADARRFLDGGFDYVEVGAAGFDALSPNWDPEPYEGLPIEATNVFFPGSIKLFGEADGEYADYSGRAIERAASLGVRVMVIGSGHSRMAPEGLDRTEAFCRIAGEIAKIAQPHGIAIAPESLNRTETNVGNDLRSLALCLREVGTGYTADSYHVLFEWDANGRRPALDELWDQQIPYAPTHVHVAALEGRARPLRSDPMLKGFAERLRTLGYDQRISLECAPAPEADLSEVLAELRALFGASS